MKDLRWYLRRGGGEGETVGRVVDIWVRLVAPFTPHMSEEIWRRLGKEGFVSLASYPNIQKDSISEITEMKEEYLKGILRDIHKVRMTANGKPKEILFYVSTKGKSFDELSHLGSNGDFLSREFGCAVRIFDADDPTSPDPGSRKAKARPLRPAIWITWN